MKTETNNNSFKSYTNSSGRNVLEYITPNTIVLDLPFIMTCDKRLSKSMPYMKLEKKVAGNDIKAVRLLDFDDDDGFIYLNVQELPDGKAYTISANMDYIGNYYLWTLADFETLTNLPIKDEGIDWY